MGKFRDFTVNASRLPDRRPQLEWNKLACVVGGGREY